MKAHVLYDDDGNVGAMSHARPRRKGTSAGRGGFLPGEGQHTAFLDVPEELAHFKPRDLHEAIRVEHRDGKPHLVAKKG
jgi:hypothetical protein